MTASNDPIVLASASVTRAEMLARAGVEVIRDPAAIDEEELKVSFRAAGLTTGEAAEALAEMKAQRITGRHPGRFVVGADQMLECDGRWFDKPRDRDEARAHLRALRGRAHTLVSCVVVVRNGTRVWHHTDSARLVMRPFSDGFVEWYLDAVGDRVSGSVGAYQLEGLGAHLFTRVEGDFFTILGLPLLPLLDYLRVRGILPS